METTITETKKGLNILKMNRKVLKNWGRPFVAYFIYFPKHISPSQMIKEQNRVCIF
jgi:hypothetical protein